MRSAAPHALRLHALPPQTTASLPAAAGQSSSLRPQRSRRSAATTAGGEERSASSPSTRQLHRFHSSLQIRYRGAAVSAAIPWIDQKPAISPAL